MIAKNINWMALALASFVVGCNADFDAVIDEAEDTAAQEVAEETTSLTAAPVRRDAARTNRELEVLAKAVARSMAEPQVRQLVKDEVLKRRTGDLEALVQQLAEAPTRMEGGFMAALARGYQGVRAAEGAGISRATAERDVATLNAHIPNLHVALRAGEDRWDPTREAPLVAYDPTGIQEHDLLTIEAFDSEGKVYFLDPNKKPDVPVLVVGVNERVDARGDLDQSLICDGCVGEASSALSTSHIEILRNVHVTDDNEPWTKGHAELRLKVAGPGGEAYSGSFDMDWESPSSRDVNRTLFNWNPDTFSPRVIYFWYESDGGFAMPVTVQGSFGGVTVGITFTIQDGDDEMGFSLVDHAAPSHLRYDTGMIDWTRGP